MTPDGTAAAEARFELWRKRTGAVLAPAVGLVLWFAPLPLAGNAHALAAVFGFTIALWMSEAIPMAVSSLLGPALLVALGVGTMATVFAPFAHPIIFLFLGSFLLAEAMQKHGLDRRIAFTLMSLPGVAKSPARMMATLGLLTALLSMWMSNTAVTAVMLPILLGVLRGHPDLAHNRKLGGALVLMVAFAASIGGLATPVGTPTNLVALGQLSNFGLERPSFARWMALGLPLSLVLIAVLFIMLRPRGARGMGALAEAFRKQRAELPRITRGEVNTAVVFALAVTCWLLPGVVDLCKSHLMETSMPEVSPMRDMLVMDLTKISVWMKARMPEELVGLFAGLVLFALPVPEEKGGFTLVWRDAAKLEWGTLLLFGGGFAMGQQISATGLSDAIGQGVATWLHNPSEGTLVAVAIVVSVLLSEATSNTASANVMVPLMIGVAQHTGADPARVAVATCLACSLGFMLPISTPPNALAYGTGLVPITRMMKYGLLLDVAGGIAVWCVARWLL